MIRINCKDLTEFAEQILKHDLSEAWGVYTKHNTTTVSWREGQGTNVPKFLIKVNLTEEQINILFENIEGKSFLCETPFYTFPGYLRKYTIDKILETL